MVSAKKYQTEKKYINAQYVKENLVGKALVIDACFNETINEQEKLCLRFKGVDKVLALNQTNLSILSLAYEDETANWVNKKVYLNVLKVKFNGDLVDSVQVSPA